MKPNKRKVVESWYQGHILLHLLKPLSGIFVLLAALRRKYLQKQSHQYKFRAPIIVVGNLTVGGSGKTPFVIWLANLLKQNGYKPGIVSRGYGGHTKDYPVTVSSDSTADKIGDEPLLIYKQTGCPVVVDPTRVRAVQYLLAQFSCDVVISDDGLQHYALPRDMEVVVVDGVRRFGNKSCLPAGPLREPVSRLESVDYVVCNGAGQGNEISMSLAPGELVNLKHPEQHYPLQKLEGQSFCAMAGIGNPQRFFDLLRRLGAKIETRTFDDHHLYQQKDLQDWLNRPVIMTEKDAVKCRDFAGENWWYLPVQAKLPEAFAEQLIKRLRHVTTVKSYFAEGETHGHKTA
ncbi:MAG: tetraacyldisaccharide 4-kinase [Gammaproteobacteria bacterium]|nr:tetraacyldisaccharide 4-kinase [Gammaproteobacteria bacterium]